MGLSKLGTVFASLMGRAYRELPGWEPELRQALEEALGDLHAEKYRESGTPAFEVNNGYYRIGRHKLRVCTEDEILISL